MPKSPEFGGSKDNEDSKDNEELSERDRLLKLLREDPKFRQEVEQGLASVNKETVDNSHALQQQHRLESRNNILQTLDPQLRIGNYFGGRDGEHMTILLGNEVVGEMVSDNNLAFMSDREFQDKAFKLYQNFSSLTESKEKTSIVITPDVQQVMDKFGIAIRGYELHLPGMDIDLFSQGENENIKLEKIDDRSISLILEEFGGRIVSYEIRDGEFLSDSRSVRMKR